MAMSLRDQLVQAGLANERQAKEAERALQQKERERQKLPKDKRAAARPAQLAGQQAQSAKADRDQQLNRQNAQQATKKALHAQIVQLIENNRLPRAQTDERFNFIDGKKVQCIPADKSVRERLRRGEIAIVRRNGGYELVPAETAARIRERDQSAVIECACAQDDGTADGVPDDLVW